MAEKYHSEPSFTQRFLKEARQRIAEQQEDLLAAQEVAAELYEANAKKDEEILDLQAAVAEMYERGSE